MYYVVFGLRATPSDAQESLLPLPWGKTLT